MKWFSSLHLQVKIFLVLIAVILPTFLIVTIFQNQVIRPVLEEEIRRIGENAARSLSTEIINERIYLHPKFEAELDSKIGEIVLSQPNITRMDVIYRDSTHNEFYLIASNFEVGRKGSFCYFPIRSSKTYYRLDESGIPYWEIWEPIFKRPRKSHTEQVTPLGMVRLVVSLKTVSQITRSFSKVTYGAALISVFLLIFALSYFLRRTIENDRLLRVAEFQNLQLSQELHEIQRELMNKEKLAVMGQLTANFAHEIGTPLNAISGHLQLMREDFLESEDPQKSIERIGIITSQVGKIEQIVKDFLQTTPSPSSQRQLVDVQSLTHKTTALVKPRLDALGISLEKKLDSKMGPIRVAPLDLEQILLNLMNNSLDSLSSKKQKEKRSKLKLEVKTQLIRESGKEFAEVIVFDSGEGISKKNLKNVVKPFFTTKLPGQGTGLGLTIADKLVKKYGGQLEFDSREGEWTQVSLRLPYREE